MNVAFNLADQKENPEQPEKIV